jgi:hypothetical protein
MSARRQPAYSVHKPSGQARVIIDRKHIYLGPHGSPQSYDRYQDLIAQWRIRNCDHGPLHAHDRRPGVVVPGTRQTALSEIRPANLGSGLPEKRTALSGCRGRADSGPGLWTEAIESSSPADDRRGAVPEHDQHRNRSHPPNVPLSDVIAASSCWPQMGYVLKSRRIQGIFSGN